MEDNLNMFTGKKIFYNNNGQGYDLFRLPVCNSLIAKCMSCVDPIGNFLFFSSCQF